MVYVRLNALIGLFSLFFSTGTATADTLSTFSGVECPNDIVRLISIYNRIKSQTTPWLSINTLNLRVGVLDTRDRALYVSGLGTTEMKNMGLDVSNCSNNHSIYKVNNPPGEIVKPGKMYGMLPRSFMIPEMTDTDPPTPEIFKRYLRYPIYMLNWPLIIPESDRIKYPDAVAMFNSVEGTARAGIHEIFHFYQFSLFKEQSMADRSELVRKQLDDDITIPAFKAEILEEINECKSLEAKMAQMSKEDAVKVAKTMIERRTHGFFIEEWKRYSIFEKVEGTAVYFETELSKKARIPNASSIFDWWPGYMRLERWSTYGSEPFYITGAVTCMLLRKLDPTGKWQKEIESGLTPFATLQKVVQGLSAQPH